MSEPLRWEEREIEIKPERVERTATYEEILKDFDNPCLVRALVERCQALEACVVDLLNPESERTRHTPDAPSGMAVEGKITEAAAALLRERADHDNTARALRRELARRHEAEAKVTEMEEALRQPVEVTVKLDTAAIVEAVLGGLKTLPGFHHGHTWHEYDGAYYCYGCKTFMPNKAARAAFEAEGQ
jgi:hypothetical protein